MRSIGPAVTREQSPAFLRNSNGRLDLPGPTGEGNGNPLQCSFLENPRDGGAWWAAVYGVAQSRTRLKWLRSSSSSLCIEIFFSKFFAIYYKNSFDWWAFGRLNIWRRKRSEHWCILCLGKPVAARIRFSLLKILLLISHAEQRKSESTKPVINQQVINIHLWPILCYCCW